MFFSPSGPKSRYSHDCFTKLTAIQSAGFSFWSLTGSASSSSDTTKNVCICCPFLILLEILSWNLRGKTTKVLITLGPKEHSECSSIMLFIPFSQRTLQEKPFMVQAGLSSGGRSTWSCPLQVTLLWGTHQPDFTDRLTETRDEEQKNKSKQKYG